MNLAYRLESGFDSSRVFVLEDLERLISVGEKVSPDLIDAYIDSVLDLACQEQKGGADTQLNWLLRLQSNLLKGAFNQSISEVQKNYFLQSLYQLFFILKPLNSSKNPCYDVQCLASKWMTLRHYLV